MVLGFLLRRKLLANDLLGGAVDAVQVLADILLLHLCHTKETSHHQLYT